MGILTWLRFDSMIHAIQRESVRLIFPLRFHVHPMRYNNNSREGDQSRSRIEFEFEEKEDLFRCSATSRRRWKIQTHFSRGVPRVSAQKFLPSRARGQNKTVKRRSPRSSVNNLSGVPRLCSRIVERSFLENLSLFLPLLLPLTVSSSSSVYAT